jgi:hypothetical protein
MPDDDDPDAREPQAEEAVAEEAAEVPPEQRGAASADAEPDPEPIGERSGGAGSAGGAAVLESPGGPSTVEQQDEQEQTLAEELVQETGESIGEVSPDMGETKPDPHAGGTRFEQLVDKRKKGGLSDDEAEELGKLLAARDGREWTSTRQLRTHPVDSPS